MGSHLFSVIGSYNSTRDVPKVSFIMIFHKEGLLQSKTYNGVTKYKLLAIFPHIRHRHCRTVKSVSRNHPGKNRCPASEGNSSQPIALAIASEVTYQIVMMSMQDEGPHADHKTERMAISPFLGVLF
ncbi:hypothetical protein AVEN_260311-1 [Araneus ventricosus]|uniref:Uncharacterized protein n=1 Tax=Araneus ventricosus TaxID=182803 RepID=A0A4Y2VEX4_ARAVE|nr:hypothetical protein AVEN_260311-1 [Araneus ventricosus]